jgi:glycosyltransferase involved in cell wall biosynthesis
MRVLFLLKKNNYGYEGIGDGAGGLLNSCRFIVDMLSRAGIEAKLVVVIDNNDINREVTLFRPDVVVIEALWVVPEKFDILKLLHPDVTWIVRIHSDFPFLASDGIAFSWIYGYLSRSVYVAFNKERTADDVFRLTNDSRVLFLPNYYKVSHVHKESFDDGALHIGCFGAVRPLKNQLIQAIAAIEYADSVDESLVFHINGTRTEQGGIPVLRNLIALFDNSGHELVLHPWLEHLDFLRLMIKMDLSMAVSFSETFCITAADAVAVNVPLVCSDQVPWADRRSIVPTTDTKAIRERIGTLLNGSFLSRTLNLMGLRKYAKRSKRIWLSTLDKFPSTM